MKQFLTIALASSALSLAACGGTEQDTLPVEPPVAGTNTDAPTETASEFTSEHLTIEVFGTGQPVILIPGLASNAAVWDSTIAALEDEYELHVVQVSGFAGAPPRGNAGHTGVLDSLADELVRYTGRLDEKPAVIGHSLGGLVALKMGIASDTSFDRLMIVDVLPFFSVLMNPDATEDNMAPVSAAMKAELLAQSDELFSERQRLGLSVLVQSPEDLELALSWSEMSDRNVMAQAMSEVIVTDLREPIGGIDVPVTIVFARDDALPNMDQTQTFYEDLYAPIPDHELIVMSNARHFVMFDRPNAFNHIVETFLAED